MATVYAKNEAKRQATPVEMPNVAESNGKLRILSDEYVANATAADTVIDCGELPKNSFVKEFTLYSGALGASVTLKAGVEDDDDALVGATNHANETTTAGNVGAVFPKYVSGRVLVTVGGATTTASDILIKLVIVYSTT